MGWFNREDADYEFNARYDRAAELAAPFILEARKEAYWDAVDALRDHLIMIGADAEQERDMLARLAREHGF